MINAFLAPVDIALDETLTLFPGCSLCELATTPFPGFFNRSPPNSYTPALGSYLPLLMAFIVQNTRR